MKNLNEILTLTNREIEPSYNDILASQGKDASFSDIMKDIVNKAFQEFKNLAHARGILKGIEKDLFGDILYGQGKNEKSPVDDIYEKADSLTLFALTLGEDLSDKVTVLFENKNYPLGYLLDTLASIASENSVRILENIIHNKYISSNKVKKNLKVLSYSPGYCGWDLSGQAKLFEFLKPGNIGITLNENYLMWPLKSVSGVLIAGDKRIHKFKSKYQSCKNCKDKSWVNRLKQKISISTSKKK
jgi:hypothetical protein